MLSEKLAFRTTIVNCARVFFGSKISKVNCARDFSGSKKGIVNCAQSIYYLEFIATYYVYFKNTVVHLLVDKPNVYRYNRYDISNINAFRRIQRLNVQPVIHTYILVSRLHATVKHYINIMDIIHTES